MGNLENSDDGFAIGKKSGKWKKAKELEHPDAEDPVMHFHPETREDTHPKLPKATYDDLLSYYNQRYHEQLERFSIKEALERLMQCSVEPQQGGKTLDEQYRSLLANYDLNSSTEKPFIEYLYQNGIALPDRAQFNVPGCYVSADFVYKTAAGFSYWNPFLYYSML